MDNKYSKIVFNIKTDIESGVLKPGSKLPSIRETSELYDCSNATVIRAYSELEREHKLYSIPKSGYYVVENNTQSRTDTSENIIDFTSALPDPTILPYRDFQHCINQAIDIYKDSLFTYSSHQGIPSLRKTLEKHLMNSQIFTCSDNIFITSGSQQALFLIAKMPFPNGKKNILVEQPTFQGMLGILNINNVTAIGIDRNSYGIKLDELERIFRSGDIKFFYTIPRFHNPTGLSYSNAEKKDILQLAQKYDVYIVEDDYLAELELDSKVDPFYAYDTTDHVIYVKSFSKTMLPGLRLAAAVIPKLLLNTFRRYKHLCDISTSVLSQGALEVYIKSGMYESHSNRVKSFYRDKMLELKKACDSLLPVEVKTTIPSTGFFSHFELTENLRSQNIVNALETQNIRIISTTDMYIPSHRKENGFRICISKVEKEKIQIGISALADEVERVLARKGAKRNSELEIEMSYGTIL